MLSNDLFDNDFFPYTESKIFEFKESICNKNDSKIIKTICAFLNSEEKHGYIILGIKDTDNKLVGLNCNQKAIDEFILKIDNIFSDNKIICSDKNNNHAQIGNTSIIAKKIINKKNKVVIVVTVVGDINYEYQLTSGEKYYRLNASNMKISDIKFYKESQVCDMIEQKSKEIQHQYNQMIDNYKQQINDLTNSIKQKDEIINALQNKSLFDSVHDWSYQYVAHFFGCLKSD